MHLIIESMDDDLRQMIMAKKDGFSIFLLYKP